MSDPVCDNKEATEEQSCVFFDDSPTCLNTAPLTGYTAINSREKIEAIDRVAPVLPKDDETSSVSSDNAPAKAPANVTEPAPAPSKPSYGGLGGRSSLLQRRLQAGSIHHFDSGEHFRLQAEKTRQEHDQRRLEHRAHPLTEKTSLSRLHPSTESAPEQTIERAPYMTGRISRLHPRSGQLGGRHSEAVPRRFASNNDSSEEESSS